MDQPRESLSDLYIDEAYDLFYQWQQVQRDSIPDIGALKAKVRKQINHDEDLMIDGFTAYQSKGPVEYYGKPMRELTQGQLIYYTVLVNAFVEFYVEGKDKQVSRKWIENEHD